MSVVEAPAFIEVPQPQTLSISVELPEGNAYIGNLTNIQNLLTHLTRVDPNISLSYNTGVPRHLAFAVSAASAYRVAYELHVYGLRASGNGFWYVV